MTINAKRGALLLTTTALAAACLMSPAAFAQEAGEEAGIAREEVVVTATRRAQSLQDVPIAVTALGAEDIDRAGVADLRTLDSLSASFNLNSTQTESQGTTLRIRGVGTTGNNIGLESAVGVFLDGVYLSRPGVALGDLVDLQQIEVLRGPQGTLFGRNTSAGALNITTREPDVDNIDAFGNLTVGNLGQFNVQAGVNLPIVEGKFATRISGAVRQRDPLVDSTAGAGSNDRDRWLVRGQALWTPTLDVSLRVIADYAEADERCCDAPIIQETGLASTFVAATGETITGGAYAFVGLPANGGVSASGPGAVDSLVANGEEFSNPFEQWGLSAQLDWDLGFANLTYIGAYRDFFASTIQNTDFNQLQVITTGGPFAAPGSGESYDDITLQTHEARLQGTAFNERLDWLFGVYYSKEEIEEIYDLSLGRDYQRYIGANLIPFVGTTLGPNPIRDVFAGGVDAAGSFARNQFNQSSDSISFFTHNVFKLTDRIDLTGGLRYVEEEKDGRFDQVAASSPACLAVLGNAASLSATPLAGLVPLAVGLSCFPFAAVANVPGTPLPVEYQDTFSDEELIYTVSGRYSFTDDISGYVSFTHGFKSGGFNLDATAAVGGASPSFKSELVDAFEVGLKSELFDGRVRANLAVFQNDLEDFQVLEFTGIQFQTFNVPKAEATGAEIEAQWFATDSLALNTAITYSDAKYPDDCGPASAAAEIRALCGQDLTNAPKFVGIIGADYERPFTSQGHRLFLSGSVRYEDDRRTSTQALNIGTTIPLVGDIQEANTKINLRAGVQSPDERWTVEVWGVNVTDEQTRNVTFNNPLRGGAYLIPVLGPITNTSRGVFIQDPATYGVTLRAKY